MDYKHGMTGTNFYQVYRSILVRCNSKHYWAYPYYGGRGIKCEWKTFEEFKEDMFESYQEALKKHTTRVSIDRINNNGNYSKDNCRWATPLQQANNKRNVIVIQYKGKSYTYRELSEISGIPKHTWGYYTRKGLSVEEIFKLKRQCRSNGIYYYKNKDEQKDNK